MKTLALERDRSEIARRLLTVQAGAAPLWGKMSAHQMVCHLSDSFRMVLGRKAVRDASGLLQRTLVKWTALYLPVPWPRGLATVPEVDQQSGGTPPVHFAADLAELAALMDLITTQGATFHWRRHPVFGRMSRAEWLRWGYLHMDHHLRQFGA